MGKKEGKNPGLIVFTPGIFTLRAAEKSDLGFICTSELSKPPFSNIMTAVWTFDRARWFRSDICPFFNDQDVVFLHVCDFFHLFFIFGGDRFFIPTL